MKDQNCTYCMENELLDAFGIKICDLNVSMLYLFKEQSHPGRVIVAYKDHVSEMVDLTAKEKESWAEFVSEGFDHLLDGSYAGAYQEKKVSEFLTNLGG
ncbi:MAG: hypothetical protein MJ077_03845 [Oscillospiraceae bacterium]|nr:hypothetical protein [Oscillospiraceae bacterium]